MFLKSVNRAVKNVCKIQVHSARYSTRSNQETSEPKENIVVLGAGVIGLTTAHLLTEDPRFKVKVTIVAKHMPGDYDIDFSSPWAGANYLPTGKKGSALHKYEAETWPPLANLAENLPEAGVHFQSVANYVRDKAAGTALGNWKGDLIAPNPWVKDVVPDFKTIPEDKLPPGVDSGVTFTTVCINTAIYLPWLASQCLRKGVKLRRGIVSHVAEAASLHHTGRKADIVVNCSGLGSLKLGGVEDRTMSPARGQIVLVRNDPGIMASVSGSEDAEDETTYLMQRAAGGGYVLGGSYEKGSWESQPDPNLASRIMKRAVDLCPQLPDGKGFENLSVIRHSVGLRPFRGDGPRIESEEIRGVHVVHNYGHGGGGYQASYVSAKEAVRLIREVSQKAGGT